MAGTAMLMTLMSMLSSSTGPTSVASASQRATGDCDVSMCFSTALWVKRLFLGPEQVTQDYLAGWPS